MPELPEVETTMRGIISHINNKQVATVNIYFPTLRWPIEKQLPSLLKDQTLQSVARRGKYIIMDFGIGTILLHLGMSGSLSVLSKSSPRRKHDHFEIVFKDDACLRLHDPRRFGAVIWCDSDWQQHELIKHLGPEPLNKDFNTEYLFEKSRNKTVSIKNFIMNSRVVVGVGNIYASESLYLAGINPKRRANNIARNRYEKLVAAIKQVLNNSIQQGGTTLKDFSNPEGNPGYFALHLNVYGRGGEACFRCQNTIVQCVIGQRSTFYCPHCQR